MAGGINTYAYVSNNPVRFTDPLGLLWSGEALLHYIGGSTTPLPMNIGGIDLSGMSISLFPQIQAAMNGGCKRQSIDINSTSPFGTSGDAAITVGTITLKLQGTLNIYCDCTWVFSGSVSSFPDTYDFNRSTHRTWAGEASTTIGRSVSGAPFPINIAGASSVQTTGKVNGSPTCCSAP